MILHGKMWPFWARCFAPAGLLLQQPSRWVLDEHHGHRRAAAGEVDVG